MFTILKYAVIILVLAPAVISYYDIDAANLKATVIELATDARALTEKHVEPIIDEVIEEQRQQVEKHIKEEVQQQVEKKVNEVTEKVNQA